MAILDNLNKECTGFHWCIFKKQLIFLNKLKWHFVSVTLLLKASLLWLDVDRRFELEVSLFLFISLYTVPCYHLSMDLSKLNQKRKKSIVFMLQTFPFGKLKSLIIGGTVKGTYWSIGFEVRQDQKLILTSTLSIYVESWKFIVCQPPFFIFSGMNFIC